MKAIKEILKDYVYGLIIWGLICLSVIEIAYASQYILLDSAFVMPLLMTFVYVIFLIFAPLGVAYMAKICSKDKMDKKAQLN